MDLATFGLTRRPFRPTPDTTLYFPGVTHELAGKALKQAFLDSQGIALLDGSPGLGKTIVAMRFLESLDSDVPRVIVPGVRFSRPADLYQSILFDLGVPYVGLAEQELRLAVADRLLASLASGHPTVLVLEEAQHLGADLLEEIRLLGNLETRSAKALFVILVALPTLHERLSRADGSGLAQRIAVRARLDAWSPEESTQYLFHQFEMCGADPSEVISEEAVQLLATRCGGVPRILNQAANLAMTLTADAGESTIECEAVLEALGQLGLAPEPEPDSIVLPTATVETPAEVRPTRPRATKRRAA